jgi:hypothetical protein
MLGGTLDHYDFLLPTYCFLMKNLLACADFTFPLLEHDHVLQLIGLLGFDGVDVGLFEGRSHLQPSSEFRNTERSGKKLAGKLARHKLKLADTYLQTAPSEKRHAIFSCTLSIIPAPVEVSMSPPCPASIFPRKRRKSPGHDAPENSLGASNVHMKQNACLASRPMSARLSPVPRMPCA